MIGLPPRVRDGASRAELLAMAAEDLRVREELARDGTLFDGYHPRMREVHERNAARLRVLLARHGWPGRSLVGAEAADAAWLILQHAIGDPPLQRLGLSHLAAAAAAGEAPMVQVAMLEDRIRCNEGRPQRYGTQFDWDADGLLSPLPIEEEAQVDERRAAVGLIPLAEDIIRKRRRAAEEGERPPSDWNARRLAMERWLRETGWRTGDQDIAASTFARHRTSGGLVNESSNPFVPAVGAVFSADIAVPEHERALRFYGRVLATGERPLWREADLMNDRGIPIIGLGERTPAHDPLPLQWMPHIQVADVGASVERAVALGGSVLMHDRDAQGTSRWAVLRDPDGAAFGIVPVVPAEALPPDTGGDVPATPTGRIAWLDLTVPDAEATRDFYRQVVGWSVHDVAMRDGEAHYADYAMLGERGTAAAGVCHARGGNAGLPPVWLIYLPVGDLEESLRRVPEEGGRVVQAKRGKDGAYVYAVVQDPVGAFLALMPA